VNWVHKPLIDGRLSLGRLYVLQERYDEAIEWFARARSVLEEQGARPLLAIAEFDQAITFSRRAGLRDREEGGSIFTPPSRSSRPWG
jgi:tetratricopeptide (TPR) repeat protein